VRLENDYPHLKLLASQLLDYAVYPIRFWGESQKTEPCRYFPEIQPEISLPKNIPDDHLIFRTNQFLVPGAVERVSHIVYVDPVSCTALSPIDSIGNSHFGLMLTN
jgi:hypothetical protein